MSSTNIFSKSIQKTDIWLKEATTELKWRDERKAYTALRSVLHALRDRVTSKEAVQLGAQLPTVIRGVYYEGWTLRSTPVRDRNKYGFLSEIRKSFGKPHESDIDTVHVARGIFRLLNSKISKGEIDDIRAVLPKGLSEFWPEEAPRKTKVRAPRPARKKTEHTVEELVHASETSGRAVTGLVRTLRALNEGRAWRILCGEEAQEKGFECSTCAALFAADRDSCSYCGSSLDVVDAMIDRVVEFARERGVEVQEVLGKDSRTIAEKAGGIGAFLKTRRAEKD